MEMTDNSLYFFKSLYLAYQGYKKPTNYLTFSSLFFLVWNTDSYRFTRQVRRRWLKIQEEEKRRKSGFTTK